MKGSTDLKKICSAPPAALQNDCKKYCGLPLGPAHGLCLLDGELLATSVALTDATTVLNRFAAIEQAEIVAKGSKATQDDKARLEELKASPMQAGEAAPLTIPGLSADFAGVALQGLAKLIQDRAEQEALVWFLDRLGASLCHDKELETYWLPSVCALAAETQLGSYAAGSALLDALRQAFLSDARQWPATAVGLGVGGLFLADAKGSASARDPVACSGDAALCTALARLRQTTNEHVTAMLDGRNALVQLAELSDEYAALNRKTFAKDPSGKQAPDTVYSPALEVGACALGLPRAVMEFGEVVSARAPFDVQAPALAALVTVPACAALLFDPAATPNSPDDVALAHIDAYGRLSVPIGGAHGMAAAFRALKSAVKELEAAVEAAGGALSPLSTLKPPVIDAKTPEAAAASLDAYFASFSRILGNSAFMRVVNATLGVGEATLAFGSASERFLQGATDLKNLAPGLCAMLGNDCQDTTKATALLQIADKQLVRLQRGLATLKRVIHGQWGQALALVMADLSSADRMILLPTYAGTAKIRHTLARHAGTLVAFLQAQNGDDVAKALDAAADPPGGWRVKARPNSRSFGIVAQPGILTAGEVRFGQYGASRERGSPVYLQAPTLALPVGFEVAWGKGTAGSQSSCALFFPLLDPAAFLQYDVSRDGHLPAASLKTALSPGFGLRFGFANSPFSLSPIFIYRPGFRAYHAAWDAIGADAFQLGVLASVDVSLFTVTKTEDEETP